MGFNFRRRVKIFKGVYLNIGKKSNSVSIGGKGITTNISQRGIKSTFGIRGTGLSYTTPIKPFSSKKANKEVKKMGNPSVSNELIRLKQLLNDGVLNITEFEGLKNKLLNDEPDKVMAPPIYIQQPAPKKKGGCLWSLIKILLSLFVILITVSLLLSFSNNKPSSKKTAKSSVQVETTQSPKVPQLSTDDVSNSKNNFTNDVQSQKTPIDSLDDGVATKNFTNCVANNLTTHLNDYQDTHLDGGESALRLVKIDCNDQFKSYVMACINTQHKSDGDCREQAFLIAAPVLNLEKQRNNPP